ncbi:uncharacterized protein METZ01_LOCUS239812 [marine metagenome]|jgi:hypothetical protein|uniref:DUF3501 domain-containing protein n=3 Tax=marine metagenome TaxID=408172 RepID=A0A382HI18_9ZZZZ
MTNLLKREDLFSLEEYAEQRSNIRKNVMNVKKLREVNLGEHIRLLFENHQTVQYQVQEMLRIEKIFEAAGIQDELDVYNPLIPDGSNLKATMMIEYTDVVERTKALSNLIGIEKSIYFQVGNHQNVYAICNEDLERETDEKTSSVHFMRFEFEQTMIADFCKGINVKIGVSHPNYDCEIILEQRVKDQLNQDFMNGEE